MYGPMFKEFTFLFQWSLLMHLLTYIACFASFFGIFFNINFFVIIPKATSFLLGRFTKGADHFPLHRTF